MEDTTSIAQHRGTPVVGFWQPVTRAGKERPMRALSKTLPAVPIAALSVAIAPSAVRDTRRQGAAGFDNTRRLPLQILPTAGRAAGNVEPRKIMNLHWLHLFGADGRGIGTRHDRPQEGLRELAEIAIDVAAGARSARARTPNTPSFREVIRQPKTAGRRTP